MTTQFTKFAHATMSYKKLPFKEQNLLALDPGETTGWSNFQNNSDGLILLGRFGQVKTWPEEDMVKSLTGLFDLIKPDTVVYERYAVYAWRAREHTWSNVPTLQIIGCIRTLCLQRGIQNVHEQTAQIAKGFCTDDNLRMWGLYERGQRHARDSIRHGAYYTMFGPSSSD